MFFVSLSVNSLQQRWMIQFSDDYVSKLCSNNNSICSFFFSFFRLLEEKEKDLELAAKIGQELLERNRFLDDKVCQLEAQVSQSTELITQLRHELQVSTELSVRPSVRLSVRPSVFRERKLPR